jgi:hypothetical protein
MVLYLSDEDRARLILLTDQLRSVGTVEEQQKIRIEISDIESRRKPIHECNMTEITELRTTIWNKFEVLNRIGKSSMAQQFKGMLVHIEHRQAELYHNMAIEEATRSTEKRKGKTPQVVKSKKAEADDTGDSKTKPRQFSSKWSIKSDSLD